MPNVNDVLEMEYPLYYDLIVSQVRLKKQDEERRKREERKIK
jgi:hypothetical protein